MLGELTGLGSGAGGGIITAVIFGVALFLKKKFEEKKNGKAGRESGYLERDALTTLVASFIESLAEDRKEMKIIFRELAQELRINGAKQDALMAKLASTGEHFDQLHESLGKTLDRVENKADKLLQRRG